MNFHLLYERSVNVLASSLAMVAQRLPFLKNLSPLLGSAGSVKFAAPLSVTFMGAQSLSGQSITIVPVNGSPNPAEASVGEPFQWAFKTSEHNPLSVKVEIQTPSGFVEGIPNGLGISSRALIWFLEGVPETPGNYTLRLTAYRGINFTRESAVPYLLTLNIAGTASPFEEFIATFWSGEDLDNPAIGGPNADPDGDGIENVLEFVLNLNPTQREAMPGTFGSDPDDASVLRYEIPLNELAADALVIFEESISGNPDDWAPVSAEESVRTNADIILTTPRGPGKKLYRLKVILQ
jgi:hypothetical protein